MKNRAFTLFAVGLVLCCGGTLWALLAAKPRPAPRPTWSPPRLPIDRVQAPAPSRFSAPFPRRVENFWEELEKGPPLSHVRLRMQEGDSEMGERFLSALREAAPLAESRKALYETFGEALWPEERGVLDGPFRAVSGVGEGEPPCEWLREQLSAPDSEHPFVRDLFWFKLTLCPGPEVEALFAREEAPLPQVLEHYHRHSLPRLTLAMTRGVHRLLAEDRQELFYLAAAFLLRSSDPAAQELLDALARQARGETLEQLQATRNSPLREEEYDERECRFMPKTHAGLDPLRIDLCLGRWARTDWVATARLASLLAEDSRASEYQQQNFAVLMRFASTAARDAWAQERGLLPASLPEQKSHREFLSLEARMRDAKRVFSFFPRGSREHSPFLQHDELLVTLAWMARPEFQGVVFEEIPPHWDGELVETRGDYTLRAYVQGERFSVTARNLRTWWDVGAVVGLLNHVLEARGSGNRFAMRDSLSPALTVIFGPEAALREAHALGLLHLGDPSEITLSAQKSAQESLKIMMGQSP